MFLPGFEWAEDRAGSPLLVWLTHPTRGHAFLQKGDGAVDVRSADVYLQAGSPKLAFPNHPVLVGLVMRAWARRVLGEASRGPALAHASGMVASGVYPCEEDDETLTPHRPASPPPPLQKGGPYVLGKGAWALPQ